MSHQRNHLYYSAFNNYQGSLPDVDWIGLDDYGIRPSTNQDFKNALTTLKNRFPNRGTIYVMDAFWESGVNGVHERNFGYKNYGIMASVAREWYNMARTISPP